MAESKKIRRYRETLQDMAKPQTEERHKLLEGKAAKLGTEIYGEQQAKDQAERQAAALGEARPWQHVGAGDRTRYDASASTRRGADHVQG